MSHFRSTDERQPISAKYRWPSAKPLLRTMAALALGYILLLAYLHYQRVAEIRGIFGGPKGLSTLNHTDRVVAYRVGKLADQKKWQEAGLEDYPIVAGPISVLRPDVEALLTTLQDRDSYIWDSVKGCIPRPGVRLDFIRGDDRLSVLICFECDMIVNYLNGKVVGGNNTDKFRPTLLRLAQSLFPDDATIQSLRPRP